jgi:phosphatidylglycerophosphatase A
LPQKFFITGIFAGYLPIAPGSWGSLVACIILWFVWPSQWYFQLLIIFLFYPVAVYFAGLGIRYYGHDGRQITIDEVIGQAVTLFMAPHNIISYILGFLLFRLFDIIKPWPAKKWEKLHGGVGVVADDIAAGVYAAITLQLVIMLLSRWGIRWI